MTGVVDDSTKNILLSIADVALNPMLSGSGTNLKMLEYFAAGIPVVSTEFGVRGLSFVHGEHLQVAAIDAFPRAIAALLLRDEAELDAMTLRARTRVETEYEWSTIARQFRAAVDSGGAPGIVRSVDAQFG